MRSSNSSTQLILLLALCATVTVGQTVWQYETNIASERLGSRVTFCDVNNDTYIDLIATSTTHLYVFLGNSSGQYAAAPDVKVVAGVASITSDGLSLTCGDLNHDGIDDVIVGNWTGSGATPIQAQYISIYNGSAAGLASTPQVLTLSSTGGYYGCDLHVADINNDGKRDLLVGAYGFGRIYIHNGNGANGVSATATGPASLYKNLLTWALVFDVCDLNGDNLPELIVPARGANAGLGANQGQVWIMGNVNGATFTNSTILNGTAAGSLFGYDLKCGDFNGDGKYDVAVLAQATKFIYFYYGTGSLATFPTVPSVSLNIVDTCRSLSVGDVNQDGYDDLVVGCSSPGIVKMWYGGPTLGNSNIPALNLSSTSSGFSVKAGPNIDGSGLNEIAYGSLGYSNGETSEGQVGVVYGLSPSVSPSVTPSISVSPSMTPSISPTASVTPSISVSPSVTPSISVSPSVTPSISVSPSVTPTISPSASVTPSTQPSPSATPSPIPSSSPSATSSPSQSPSPSATPSSSPSNSPSGTPSISVSPSTGSSPSSTPSVTPSISTSPSVTPSISVSPSKTPSPVASSSSSPSISPSTSASASPVIPSPSSSPSSTPSSSSSASPTSSAVAAVSTSPSASPSAAAASVSPSPEVKKTYTDCKMTLEGDTFDEQQFLDDMASILGVDEATLAIVSSKKSVAVTLRIFDTPGQDSVAVAKDLQNLVATSDPILAEYGITITSLSIDDSHAASAQDEASSSGLSTGGIVAIAVVVPVAALALIGLAFVAYKKKNSRGSSNKREVELANVETKKKAASDEESGTSESDETSDSEDDSSSEEESSEEDSESSEETSESETASKSKASDSSSESESSSA